jgi:hypothetical protein
VTGVDIWSKTDQSGNANNVNHLQIQGADTCPKKQARFGPLEPAKTPIISLKRAQYLFG